MATVNITISDMSGGLVVKLTSDEPMPKDGDDGSISQNIGIICMAYIKREIQQITGRELHFVNIQ